MTRTLSWKLPGQSGYWNDPHNWLDVTSGSHPASLPPTSGDRVTLRGPTGFGTAIVAGSGSAGAVDTLGKIALEGDFSFTGALTIGPKGFPAGSETTTSDVLAVEQHTSVSASSITVRSELEIDGPGATVTAGRVTVSLKEINAVYDPTAQLAVLDGGLLVAASLINKNGPIFIDARGVIEIGRGGHAQQGALTVDQGATFINQGFVAATVVDTGVLLLGGHVEPLQGGSLPVLDGNVIGTGTLIVDQSLSTIQGAVSGLALVRVITSSSLTVGSLVGNGSIVVGDTARGATNITTLTAGAVTNDGPITVGHGSRLITGDITGNNEITVEEGGTLAMGSPTVAATLSGLSSVHLASNTTFSLNGTDTDVPLDLRSSNGVVIELTAGSNISGAVSGFNNTDAIVSSVTSRVPETVDQATWSANVLTLSSSGHVVSTIDLIGNFAGQEFVVYGAGAVPGSSTIALVGTTIHGFGTGNVHIGRFQQPGLSVIVGGGTAESLTITNAVGLEGTYAVGTLALSSTPLGPQYDVEILANSTVSVAGDASVMAELDVQGDGGRLSVAGTLTIGTAPVVLLGNAHLQAASLNLLTGSGQLGVDLTLFGNSSAEIGKGGAPVAAGTLQIDAGASVTVVVGNVFAGTVTASIQANTVEDNGVINEQGTLQDSFLSIRGNLSGSGTLDGSCGVDVAGSVSNLSSIEAGHSLSIGGDLLDVASITIGYSSATTPSFSSLSVTGQTKNLGTLILQAYATASLEGIATGIGSVNVPLGGALDFGAAASGHGTIRLGDGASLGTGGTFSGWSHVVVGHSATVTFAGAFDVPMSLAGGDTLVVKGHGNVLGAITGFDSSDQIQVLSTPFLSGGTFITGAQWDQATGILTLSEDGRAVSTLHLAGNYAGQSFISWALDSVIIEGTIGESSVSIARDVQAGLHGSSLKGDTGQSFLLVTGSGTQSALSVSGNVALGGRFRVQNLTLSSSFENITKMLVEQGATIAGQAATINGELEVDNGRLTVAQSVTLEGFNTELAAVNGATLQFASLDLIDGSASVLANATIAVDATSAIEVGDTGHASDGALNVDTGAEVDSVSAAFVECALNVNGLYVADGLTKVYGDVDGSGAIRIEKGGIFTADQALRNLKTVDVAGTLSVTQDVEGVASLDVSGSGIVSVGNVSDPGLSGSVLANLVVGSATIGDRSGSGAKLTVSGNVSGTGTLGFGVNATGTIGGTTSGFTAITLGNGATISFGGAELGSPITLGADNTITFGAAAPIDGVISGFSFSDTLLFRENDHNTATIITGAVYTRGADGFGILTLQDDGTTVSTLRLFGDYTGEQFLTNFAGEFGETRITLAAAPCFTRGTRILTQRGEVPVETLSIGDRVVTLSGRGNVLKPVIWIGRSPFDIHRHPDPDAVIPVRIRRDALDAGVPHRDMLVSPGHSFLLDGVLMQASRLVNGATILRDSSVARGEYFHVELAEHDILLSEGAPSESYLDTGNRGAFVNGGGATDLFPDYAPRHWSETCVELVQEGPRLVAQRARLLQRALEAGYRLTDERNVRIVADGRVLAVEALDADTLRVSLPEGCNEVRIVSSVWVPAQVQPQNFDVRRLGVCVAGIAADGGRAIPLDGPALTLGWHGVEREPDRMIRWTDGAAVLRLSARTLTLSLCGARLYWRHEQAAPAVPQSRESFAQVA